MTAGEAPSGQLSGPVNPAAAPPSNEPPPWLRRALLMFFVGVVVLGIAFWLFMQLRSLLLLLLVSLFLSLVMEPGVNALSRWGWRRDVATAVVMTVIMVGLGVFTVLMASLLVDQTSTLIRNVPTYAEQGVNFYNDRFEPDLSSSLLLEQLNRFSSELGSIAGGVATSAADVGAAAGLLIFQVLAVALFAVYMTADAPRLRRVVCSLMPPARQRVVLHAWEIAIDQTGSYLYSRGLLAIISAVAHAALLLYLDLPFAIVLALWIGTVSQFIPTIGIYLAGVIPVVVALGNDPLDALWLVIFMTLYQQIENFLLSPRLTAETMSLHPAVAFGAVLAGGYILGAIGAFIALPVTASIQAFASNYLRMHDVVLNPLTNQPVDDEPDPKQVRQRDRRWRLPWSRRPSPETTAPGKQVLTQSSPGEPGAGGSAAPRNADAGAADDDTATGTAGTGATASFGADVSSGRD